MESIYVILICLIIIGILTFFGYRDYQRNIAKFLKGATVGDITVHPVFLKNMEQTLTDLDDLRAKDLAKAIDKGGSLKSHPIDVLREEGVLNAADMTELFLHSLQKTLIGYSKRERDFIRSVGMMAYNRTMLDLQRKAGMKNVKA